MDKCMEWLIVGVSVYIGFSMLSAFIILVANMMSSQISKRKERGDE